MDIHVPALRYSTLLKLLVSRGIQHTILISDLQSSVDKEKQEVEASERSARAVFNYGQYNRLEQVSDGLYTLVNSMK